MAASAAISTVNEVQAFITEYFGAWEGTDIERIMGYYTDDVLLEFAGTPMSGKQAVEENFVRPFVAGFPGNRHVAQNMIFGPNVVVVEWSFEAEHTGPFAGKSPTGASVKVPGCSVYEYDGAKRQITGGRIYVDTGTLLKQIGAA
jgi:predicted ester cyclase